MNTANHTKTSGSKMPSHPGSARDKIDREHVRGHAAEVSSTVEPRDVAAMHLEHRYDLILLDLQMPEMTGLQVMAQLQEGRASNPVSILVLSADATQNKTALAEGADSFMGKPFRLPDVVERVQSMLKIQDA